MSMKNKLRETGVKPETTPQLPIQDDPYWKVSRIFMDIHRIGRYIERFDLFADQHPQWVDDIMEGFPTYYCVLGVYRGAPLDQVVSAYKKRIDSSIYPLQVIQEAFSVLSNLWLQVMYDDFLIVFEQYMKKKN
jgi:hypothetical protein